MAIKIIDKKEAAELAIGLSGLFVRIPNPSYVYPPYEICPIAAPLVAFDRPPVAAVMDMDGTTTTTETLCLHSLEHAVRISMGAAGAHWPGLDPQRDYPNVIGNSTTKHVEYLVDAYGARFDTIALAEAFLKAADWTLKHSRDEQRRLQVQINLRQLGAGDFASGRNTQFGAIHGLDSGAGSDSGAGFGSDSITDAETDSGADSGVGTVADSPAIRDALAGKLERRDLQVQACIDIYYQRYHEILAAIEAGDQKFLTTIPGVDAGRPLIEPMPGVAITLALLSGDLGGEAGKLAGLLAATGAADKTNADAGAESTLSRLGEFFRQHPVRLALVTSSIRYEAEVVMREVFNILRQDAAGWPLSAEVRQRINRRFSSPDACYDAFVTATDSSEIRLKPFRDLYSIALQQAGVGPENFDAVIGFEDSQSGTVAIRTAGIGRCVAVPFHETGGHDFDAASVVALGGLPEVLLQHRFFLDKLVEKPA